MLKNLSAKFSSWLLRSPGIQIGANVLLTIVIGFFCSTLGNEITTSKGVDWSLVVKTFSFKVLCALGFVMWKYQLLLYKDRTSIKEFKDDAYCLAYMRSMCLPEVAKKAQEKIRAGQGGEFLGTMEELDKVLKIK